MITCNHCGRPNPVNAVSCQNCGSPLINKGSGAVNSNFDPGMIAPDQQPELPAWLETLRTGEHAGSANSAAPGGEAANFIANELINEDMLPGWMRPERREMSDSTPLESYPPRRPARTPAPNTDSAFAPGRGMDASSLIDQQALPAWLQEHQTPAQVQDNIPAASLLQQDALPEWLRRAQPQAPAPTAAEQNEQPVIPPQGIMGNDLIDGRGLPQWMSSRETPSAPAAPEQPGLSASSLLDANALPAWLRQPEQGAQTSNAQGFPPAVQPAAYNQVYQSQPAPGPAAEEAGDKSGISASSFIEMDSLPDWLRANDEQRQLGAPPQQQNFADPSRQAAYGAPARPVPSRPRGEMPAHEESAVAANVFASMLGVASAAPYLPGQQAQNAPAAPSPHVQQNVAQPQAQNAAAAPHLGVSSMQAGPMPPAYASGSPNYMGVPSQPGYAQAGGAPPGNMPMPPVSPVAPQQPPAMGAPLPPGAGGQAKAKPAKRGFLSTILDWFSR